MYLNSELQNVEIICINLITRKDRKLLMKLQCKNKNIPITFYSIKPNKDPKRGCLESHLNIIKNAKTDYLMILEDDAKIIRPLLPFPIPPTDWDILYLGGTIHQNFGDYDKNWCRVATWTCHSYIINIKNKELINDILKAEFQNLEIDEYLIKNIHYKYKCYMINPMRIIQRDGYSDIEKQKVEYSFMEETLNGFMQPEFEKTIGGNSSLKIDFIPPELLPNVSIITPTYNRRNLFPIVIRNFQLIEYPKNKLEWIIIDDSTDAEKSVLDILPKDNRIKYVPIKTNSPLSVAYKRNIGNKEAKYDYRIHMDDDDYYPPGSLMIRIKMLLQYQSKGIGCVGCSKTGIYDIIQNKSSIATDGIISLSEASMGYTKQFWIEQNFNELEKYGEYRSFIHGRFNKILDLPYTYILIAFIHNKNFTESSKKIDKNVLINKITKEQMNFYNTFDEETKDFIDSLRKRIKL